MIKKHFRTESMMPNPWNLKAQKFHDSSCGDVLHITLDPGESMVRHIPPVDVSLYVLEGEPVMESGESKQQVEQDTYIETPKGSVMCVYNQTEKKVRLLIIKLSKSTEPPVILD